VEFVLSKGQDALKIALTGTFFKKIPLYLVDTIQVLQGENKIK
jgi:hypothetical protein